MKQPYTKPVLSSVELVAEQAVLQGCKAVNFGGGQTIYFPGSVNCESGSGQCHTPGS